jgi:hypothetical protein
MFGLQCARASGRGPAVKARQTLGQDGPRRALRRPLRRRPLRRHVRPVPGRGLRPELRAAPLPQQGPAGGDRPRDRRSWWHRTADRPQARQPRLQRRRLGHQRNRYPRNPAPSLYNIHLNPNHTSLTWLLGATNGFSGLFPYTPSENFH